MLALPVAFLVSLILVGRCSSDPTIEETGGSWDVSVFADRPTQRYGATLTEAGDYALPIGMEAQQVIGVGDRVLVQATPESVRYIAIRASDAQAAFRVPAPSDVAQLVRSIRDDGQPPLPIERYDDLMSVLAGESVHVETLRLDHPDGAIVEVRKAGGGSRSFTLLLTRPRALAVPIAPQGPNLASADDAEVARILAPLTRS